jgi:glutamate 5-kinase
MRIVFKIEIETLFDDAGVLSPDRLEYLAMICANLQNSGSRVMIVSSGAIALGAARLGLKTSPTGITAQQATAAVGQVELIKAYQNYFDEFDQVAAQILLTKDVIDNPVRNLNAKNTLIRLMEKGIIPLINENDSVSTNDIILNDNFPLALIVTSLTDADLIVVNTFTRNKFLLLFKNSSVTQEVTAEELLYISDNMRSGKFPVNMDIKGFPEFPGIPDRLKNHESTNIRRDGDIKR